MSIESWKAEFYPIPAEDCPKEQAITHSLRKWEGLRKDALGRHAIGLTDSGFLIGGDRTIFLVNASSCALCEHFYNEANEDEPCANCPLAIARGGFACDCEKPCEHNSPWAAWQYNKWHDPEPMIAALKAALASQPPHILQTGEDK